MADVHLQAPGGTQVSQRQERLLKKTNESGGGGGGEGTSRWFKRRVSPKEKV